MTVANNILSLMRTLGEDIEEIFTTSISPIVYSGNDQSNITFSNDYAQDIVNIPNGNIRAIMLGSIAALMGNTAFISIDPSNFPNLENNNIFDNTDSSITRPNGENASLKITVPHDLPDQNGNPFNEDLLELSLETGFNNFIVTLNGTEDGNSSNSGNNSYQVTQAAFGTFLEQVAAEEKAKKVINAIAESLKLIVESFCLYKAVHNEENYQVEITTAPSGESEVEGAIFMTEAQSQLAQEKQQRTKSKFFHTLAGETGISSGTDSVTGDFILAWPLVNEENLNITQRLALLNCCKCAKDRYENLTLTIEIVKPEVFSFGNGAAVSHPKIKISIDNIKLNLTPECKGKDKCKISMEVSDRNGSQDEDTLPYGTANLEDGNTFFVNSDQVGLGELKSHSRGTQTSELTEEEVTELEDTGRVVIGFDKDGNPAERKIFDTFGFKNDSTEFDLSANGGFRQLLIFSDSVKTEFPDGGEEEVKFGSKARTINMKLIYNVKNVTLICCEKPIWNLGNYLITTNIVVEFDADGNVVSANSETSTIQSFS